ncbi:hypothetical protein ACH47X_13730 [Promicromonospora kroppenstedtii]|uniref:Uncharacterized protein n=1 Tax=Promicromonospora kroppenstedtii TaxID=440482 RepID=A0ABW7XKX6_9MICO
MSAPTSVRTVATEPATAALACSTWSLSTSNRMALTSPRAGPSGVVT